MDALGLTMPTTTDEFVDVLRAFRDGDPNGNGQNDEIPMVVEYGGGDHSLRLENMASFWGVYSNMGYAYMSVEDGKASMYIKSDAYREILEYMKLLWEEKLIDNAIFTQTGDVALSKFNSEISGCFGLSSDDLWSKYSADYTPMPPVQAPGGKQPVIGLGSPYAGACMVITKMDQTPEITVRWIDYFFTEEGSMFIGGFSPELEGVTGVIQPDGHYEYTDAMMNDERGISVTLGEACPLPGGGFPYWRNENNSNYIYSDTVKNSVPVYEPFYQKDPSYAYPVFDLETAEKVSDIRRDLDIYIRECQAKFVTGEMSFDQWDEYLKTLDQMRITELEGYFQAVLDNM
jgi:putative aldouronate transport system substrate-binding protein